MLSNCQLNLVLIILNSPISCTVFHVSHFCMDLMSEHMNFAFEVCINPIKITVLLGDCVNLRSETARTGYKNPSQPRPGAHSAQFDKNEIT